MPWNSNDSDPLAARRRQLADQERLLLEQRRRLTDQLQQSGEFSPANARRAEPPVWRMEEDGALPRAAEPISARKRHLARQRQRDMVFVFILIGLLLIVLVVVLWVAYVHNSVAVNGA
jgi:hypothetical protein